MGLYDAIVVPLDGSELAEQALPVAEELARASGSKVILVRSVLDHITPRMASAEFRSGVVAKAQQYLTDIASRLENKGISTETYVPTGRPVAGIIKAVQQYGGDLVVMTTHGRGGLGRWLYGSVADAMLRNSPVPVLLLRAWKQEPEEIPQLTQKPLVMVPLDGSEESEDALPFAQQYVQTFGGKLHLVRFVVRPDMEFGPDRLMADYLQEELRTEQEEATRYIQDIASRLRREGYDVQADALVTPPDIDIGHAISNLARDTGIDLVVMNSHRLGGFTRLVMGSVTLQVIRDGVVPIMIVPLKRVREASAPRKEQAVAPLVEVRLSDRDIEIIQIGLNVLLQTDAPLDETTRGQIRELRDRLSEYRESGQRVEA